MAKFDVQADRTPFAPPRPASWRVLQRLHGRLRTCLAEDDKAADALARFLDTPANRETFRKWIDIHQESLSRPAAQSDTDGADVEWLSYDLTTFLETARCVQESASGRRLWELRRELSIGFPTDAGSRRRDIRRRDLFEWISEVVDGWGDDASGSTGRAGDTERDALVRLLLAVGVGLVFIRYSPAMQESYYHWLSCDLLPRHTSRHIVNTLAVPHGMGTVGWIMQAALQQAAREADDAERPDVLTLHSSFIDPKGRVAFEDLLVGNRSIAAIPVVGDERQEIGVIFCFFPADGIFAMADDARSNFPDGYSHVNFSPTPFSKQFRGQFWSARRELLLALEVEDATKLYEVSRQSTASAPCDSTRMRPESTLRSEWVQRGLVSGERGVDDPLGFQIAMDVSYRAGSLGTPESLTSSVYLREEMFANQLFNTLRLACFYPGAWAPQIAVCLDVLQSMYHQFDAERRRTTWNAPIVSHPLWFRAIRLEGEADKHAARLEWTPCQDEYHGRNYKSLTQTLKAQGKIFASRLSALQETMAASKRARREDDVARTLDLGLNMHAASGNQFDLIVPLVDVVSEPTTGESGRWCAGFVRIKCYVQGRVVDGKTESRSDAESLRELFDFFCEDETGKNAVGELAALLYAFEAALRLDQNSLGFEHLKTILDLRTVVCRAFAEQITQPFHLGQPDLSAIEYAKKALEFHEQALDSDPRRSKVYKNLHDRFVDAERAIGKLWRRMQSRLSRLPKVTLASIWLTRRRPVITHCQWDEQLRLDRDFLLIDQGATNLLPLYLRLCRLYQVPIDIELGLGRRESGTSHDASSKAVHGVIARGAADVEAGPSQVIVPPIFFRDGAARIDTFARMQIAPDGKHARFDADNSTLEIDWAWDRFPSPEGFAYVPGEIEKALLGCIQSLPNHRLTEYAEQLDRPEPDRGPLAEILRSSDGSPSPEVAFLDRLAKFMGGERLDDGRPSQWRVIGLSSGARRGVLVAYGQPNEPKSVDNFRNTAIEGMKADFARMAKDTEIRAAAKAREILSWNRHLVGNAFDVVLSRLKNFRNKHCQRSDEAKRDAERLYNQFQHVQCVLECATQARSRKSMLDNLINLHELLTRLWQWLPQGLMSEVAGELDLQLESPEQRLKFTLPTIRVLYMILANLIHNAVNHTAPHSHRRVPLVNVRARYSAVDEVYQVTIENTGVSMDDKARNFLEGRSNSPPTTKKKSPETGTTVEEPRGGLLTVRTLLQDHGVELPVVTTRWDDNAPSTRIVLTIPRRDFARESDGPQKNAPDRRK